MKISQVLGKSTYHVSNKVSLSATIMNYSMFDYSEVQYLKHQADYKEMNKESQLKKPLIQIMPTYTYCSLTWLLNLQNRSC